MSRQSWIDTARLWFAEKALGRPVEGDVAYTGDRTTTQEQFDDREIVKSKGIGYLRRMRKRNPLIKGLLRNRKERLLRRGWEIAAADADARSEEAADLVRRALDGMDGAFEDDLKEFLDAIDFGWALSEIVWDKDSDGMSVPRSLKSLPIENFRIVCDPYGNVVEVVQTTPVRQTLAPPEKFVHARFEGDPGDPYGGSLLADVYWPDWFMRNGWSFWATALERFGMPMTKVEYPRNADSATRTRAEELADNIQSATGVALSEDLRIELIEAAMSGAPGFEAFLRHQADMIRVGIAGQTLTSGEGQSGSYSLGQVHGAEFDSIVDGDAVWLESVINEQIIPRIIDYNMAGVEYPEFRFLARETEDLDKLADRVLKLAAAGVAVSTAWAHERFGIPTPEAGEELLKPSPPTPLPQAGEGGSRPPVPPPPGSDGEDGDEDGEDEDDAAEFGVSRQSRATVGVSGVKPGNVQRFGVKPRNGQENSGAALRGVATVVFAEPYTGEMAFWREFTEFENGAVLVELERVSRDLWQPLRGEARDAWADIRDALVSQVERMQAVEDGNIAVELAVPAGMKDRWSGLVERLWFAGQALGMQSAMVELPRSPAEPGNDAGGAVLFAEDDIDIPGMDAAREWLAGRVPVTDTAYRAMAEEARRQAFYIATRETSEAVAEVYDALKETLDNAGGVADFRRNVTARFTQWTGHVFGSADPVSLAQADQRLATVFRTNTMNALNRGRDAIFEVAEDPELTTDPVVAYQYSAVMDSATRATHAAMDGRVYLADDPIWEMWNPPCGYNCRCMRVPIVSSVAARMGVDQLSTEPARIDGADVQPDKGFGRAA